MYLNDVYSNYPIRQTWNLIHNCITESNIFPELFPGTFIK